MATASKTTARAAKEYLYEWEGKDRNARQVRGEMNAAGENQVRANLRRQGIFVTKIQKRRLKGGRKIKGRDIAIFTRQLSTMMRAGVPLLQSFDIVARGNPNPSVTKLLTTIKSDVETGTSLSAAFRKHPLYFNNLYCNLVEAGEAAGILEDLLDRLATYMEKLEAIKSKVKSALMYPVAVLIVAAIVLTVIMLWVIPAFKEIFSSFGAELPAPTLIVMGISDFVVQWFWLIAIVLGGGSYFLYQAWRRSEKLQIIVDKTLLQLPIFGELVNMSSIARWTRTLSTMFAAGVPLVESLDAVGGASGNYVYKKATDEIQKEVAGGTSLSAAMADTKAFPSMVLQMAAIGEESGSLDQMLGKAADFYEAEVDTKVEGLSTLLEPLIIVFLGGLIGSIVVAMYLPIFKLGQVV
ncbi:type II secretion system F family protein [Corticibacter populi]|uniref:Type II secretion system F family protein n=1 Tax=Corticibacter populi TaxID=1550736 RepID=A0A3M6QT18_9BURK|nr:type II secretion system F family protein [Corticibacter populi]RMX05612.1 type II secretion system F family protein [Corticibacter populi]RZS31119.1 type IV pilus assembly protein PilC [Corticibacter populi]